MFNGSLTLVFEKESIRKKIIVKGDYEDGDIIIVAKEENGRLKVQLTAKEPIRIVKSIISIDRRYNPHEKVFVNGFQSWTNGREYTFNDKMPRISPLASFAIKKYALDKYGDYAFVKYTNKKGMFHGFTYSYIKNHQQFDFYGSMSEQNGYTIFYHDMKKHELKIEKDIQGLHIEDKYLLFDLYHIKADEKTAFDHYFELQNIAKPKYPKMNGWTSWYNYYEDISEAIILDNLKSMDSLENPIDIFQIDDGYESFVGDWLYVDPLKFPNGMKALADSIKEKGYKAGIWLAPFVCETNSEIYKNKKDWLLQDELGNYIHAGHNWSGFYALNIYHEDVKNYIKQVFDTVLNVWGYDMVKLDFLYAISLIPYNNKSRGQIMCEGMEFLRECVGDKLILGCGVPLGPSFGLVDYCRIGCDVGLDWDDKWFMGFMHRERISTKNAIENTIFRRQLDGRAFMNDPDVFLLRENNISLSNNEKKLLGRINKILGSLIFTSDDISQYTEEQKEEFNNIMDGKDYIVQEVDEKQKGLIYVRYEDKDSSQTEKQIKNVKSYNMLINLSDKKINYNSLTIDGKSIIEF